MITLYHKLIIISLKYIYFPSNLRLEEQEGDTPPAHNKIQNWIDGGKMNIFKSIQNNEHVSLKSNLTV